jgi:hypothetical protein
MVPDSPHLIAAERPDVVVDAVLQLLDELREEEQGRESR